jgi:hypothetical protein
LTPGTPYGRTSTTYEQVLGYEMPRTYDSFELGVIVNKI